MRAIHPSEPTRYEVAAVNGDRKILVGYTTGKSRARALDLLTGMITRSETAPDGMSGKVERIMRVRVLAEMTGTDAESWQTRRGDIAYCGAWSVVFTGRTQRQAYGEGELPESIYQEVQP